MILDEHVSPVLIQAAKKEGPEAIPFLLGKLLQAIYLQHTPRLQGTVFLLTQVHPDGFGDYLALIKAGRGLKKRNPHLNFELVFTYSNKLPEVNTEGLTLHPFLEHPSEPILEPILEGKKVSLTSAEAILADALYERMQKSLALVHVALAFNTFDNPLLAKKSLYFSEFGNFQGFRDSLHFNWYSQGLGAFEEGIFLDSSESQFINSSRFLSYIQKNQNQAAIFNELVYLWAGKEVEILHPKTPLPYETFQSLMQNSGLLVGCTGDGSLSECLALGKIPYYECRSHKKGVLEALIQLAAFLHLSDVEAYFKAMPDKPAPYLYEILTRPTFYPDWKKLIAHIHTWCRLEDSLNARLRRILFKTEEIEKNLAEQILTKKISWEEAYDRFKSHFE